MTIEAEADIRRKEAVEWFARLNQRKVTTADVRGFSAWRRHPDNACAFQKVEAMWDAAGALAGNPEIAALTTEAVRAGQKRRRRPSGLLVPLGVAGAAALAICVVSIAWLQQRPMNVKNLLDYDALWPAPATASPEAAVISDYFRQIGDIIAPLAEITPDDWLAALGPDRKAVPPVMFIGQAAAFAHPTYGDGPHPMAIKGMATYLDPAEDPVGAMRLAKALNDAAQQFT